MDYSLIFKIDWYRFGSLLTPPFLRKSKHLAWIYSLLKPMEEFNFVLNSFRDSSIYRVTHNGQVFSLENVLNDSFDLELRRIYITDALDIDATYVYPEDDNKPVIINSETSDDIVYIYSEAQIRASNFDFTVNIPRDLMPSSAEDELIMLTQIRGLVDTYKLASKRYETKWIF